MKTYAVLTGDLVQSSELDALLRVDILRHLKQLANDFSQRHPSAVVGDLDVFRGDSWQLCLTDPSLAFTAAVFLRAGLKAHPSRKNVDTRVGIGIGEADHLSVHRISESNGEAFILSGKALDLMKDDRFLVMAHDGGTPTLIALAETFLPLLDLESTRWTHPESVAIYGELMGWTQQQTADHSLSRKTDGKQPSRQSITDALKRVNWKSHLEECLVHASQTLQSALSHKRKP